jgi:CBS domain-containing protein
MEVKEMMTSPAITVREDATLRDVAEILVAQRVSGLPVLDADGALVGVISETDIVEKERGESSEARTAGEAMTAPAVTIEPRRLVTEAARIMLREEVNHLPVVSDGALVGIVTRADLVRAFVRPDVDIREEIRESAALRWHGIDPNGLVVSVHEGEVELSGAGSSAEDTELVERLVRQIPGVVSVKCSIGAADDALTRG